MSPQPFYGGGFTLLPLRDSALSGKLSDWQTEDLSTLVVLAAHANRHGVAFPSLHRIATLGGLSKSAVGPSLQRLTGHGWIRNAKGGRGRKYTVELGESSDSVAVRHCVVLNGIWASITPSCRILFVLLQALSRPGDGRFGTALSVDEWESAVEEGKLTNGCRHVLLHSAAPSELCRLCGIADRTFRKSMNILIEFNLVEIAENSDTWLLPNNPTCWFPSVLQALIFPDPSELKVTSGARRSLSARRRRRAQMAQLVPVGGASPSGRGKTPLE